MKRPILRRLLPGTAFAFAFMALQVQGQQPSAREENILALSHGSVLVSSPASYGDKWWPLYVIDGTTKSGWASAKGHTKGNEFVFELPQRYRLTSIVLDNTGNEEKGFPGVSARNVELWVANAGGFTKTASFEAVQGGRKAFALPAAVEAQRIKLVVVDNWSNPDFTELMEVEAYGEAVGAAPARAPINGVFDTNYNALRLRQIGNTIAGCYLWNNGPSYINGATDGRIINAVYDEPPPQGSSETARRRGVAVLVLNTAGNFLSGIWYRWIDGDPAKGVQYGGTWSGTRGVERQTCTLPGDTVLSRQIDQSGRAILYGIHFASDSAELQPDSMDSLQQVAALMKQRPNLRMTVEGHTDSTNTDAYNLDLSRRRAEAVVKWLGEHGIATDRLAAKGFGRQRPVADNATAQGRALNRRVEISILR